MPTAMRTARKNPPHEPRKPRTRTVAVAVAAAVALVAVVVLLLSDLGSAAQPAAAPPTFRPLAGAGSDTTQDVENALSATVLDLTSYAPRPGGQITTKAKADNPECTIARPDSDVRGIEALIVAQELARQAGTRPCIDFARSTIDSSTLPGLVDAGLTYIPFATDAVTFAQRADSPNPRSLRRADLAAVFSCAAPDRKAYLPLLPKYGSGLRNGFLARLGLTDIPSFTAVHPCVTEVDDVAGRSENAGSVLNDPRQITPYSVAQYLAQTGHATGDVHGTAVLGMIDGVAPTVPRTGTAVGIVHRADNALGRVDPRQLKALYTCTAPGALQVAFRPMLPPTGSPVRAAFLAAIGVTDTADFDAAHPCVGRTTADNNGTLLTDPRQIAPYSVPQYLAQLYGTVADLHGFTILGPVTEGGLPAVLNPAFPLAHDVYNVVPTRRLAERPTSTVFVGAASSICAATATITAFGFGVAPDCGATSIHTPS